MAYKCKNIKTDFSQEREKIMYAIGQLIFDTKTCRIAEFRGFGYDEQVGRYVAEISFENGETDFRITPECWKNLKPFIMAASLDESVKTIFKEFLSGSALVIITTKQTRADDFKRISAFLNLSVLVVSE